MTTQHATRPGRLAWVRLLPEVVTLALCVPLWQTTASWSSTVGGPGPAFYPRMLIGLLVVVMLVRLVQDVRALRAGAPADEPGGEEVVEEGVEMDTSLIDMRRVAVAIALAVAYVAGSLYLGWVIATFLVVVAFLWLTGKRNPLITVGLGLLFSLGMAYVFVKVVYISLPTGVGVFDQLTVLLFEWLGVY